MLTFCVCASLFVSVTTVHAQAVEVNAPIPEAPAVVEAPLPPVPAAPLGTEQPSAITAQADALADAALTENILALLRFRASATRRQLIFGGVGALAMGLASTAFGVTLLATADSRDGFAPVTANAFTGGFFVALGPALLVQGIGILSMGTPPEDRLQRYEQLFADGMSPAEHAALEGELRADAATAHYQRRRAALGMFGIAAGGAAVLITTAATSSGLGSDDRTFGLTFGVSAIGIGALAGILLTAIKFPQENDFDAFEAGAPPESYSLNVAPTVYAQGAGVSLNATF